MDKYISLDKWKNILDFPCEKVIGKTLEDTTNLCIEPVEMDCQNIPRYHQKNRLLPLYPRIIKGKVNSEDFFTVKSIQNDICVQLFVYMPHDLIFFCSIQREAHSHGDYQDII